MKKMSIVGYMKSKITFLLFYVMALFNCEGEERSLDEIYHSYLSNVEGKIQNSGADKLFLFFTDTHVFENEGETSYVIKSLLKNTSFENVVWGGDAITAYGKSIEDQWKTQIVDFDTIRTYGKLYCLRGNHDFTIKNSKTNGFTYSQKKTAKLIFEQCNSSIIRNTQEETGCYYYFDDDEHKIRYVVWDTNDSQAYEDKAWGLLNQVSTKQLSWLVNEAILSTPKSYSIIMLSHIGIVSATNPNCVDLAVVKSVVEAVQSKSKWSSNGIACDFSQLNEGVRILMCLSGHTHQDLQTCSNGIWHITSASDAFYSDYQKALIVPPMKKRSRESVTEHVVDCVMLNRSLNQIIFNRVGVGVNRIFNLTPIVMKVNSSVRLFESSECGNFYGCYSAGSEKYSASGWSVSEANVELTKDGLLNSKQIGNSIAYYYTTSGDLVFYYIKVEK
ncbi:MAG: metallophosphoesterase [Paludibacteraceae bacterium]|nr:metallophosphoesterase [Paludibacteraceae bacterium]MCQ2218216.1 metallophosphoesterase [Paludibacteraceae bacterium]